MRGNDCSGRREHVEAAVARLFGERVRAVRRAAGRTQQQLADRLGMSRPSVANIEAGTQGNPSVALLVMIAATLGTDHGALIGDGATSGLARALDAIRDDAVRARESAGRLWERDGATVDAVRMRGVAEGLESAARWLDVAMAEARTAWTAAGLGVGGSGGG